jgi:hypothetical protein
MPSTSKRLAGTPFTMANNISSYLLDIWGADPGSFVRGKNHPFSDPNPSYIHHWVATLAPTDTLPTEHCLAPKNFGQHPKNIL